MKSLFFIDKFQRQTECPYFLNTISLLNARVSLVIDPWRVSIANDGRTILCDWGDKSVKVLSPDGTLPRTVPSPFGSLLITTQGMFVLS